MAGLASAGAVPFVTVSTLVLTGGSHPLGIPAAEAKIASHGRQTLSVTK